MRTFRLHVVSLPHTQTTHEFDACAYTAKVRKFCDMMSSLGHEVILYASEENEAEVTELVTCITRQEQQDLGGFFGADDILKINFDESVDYWDLFLSRCIDEMESRVQPRDLICIISGWTQKRIADHFRTNMTVEFGVGYSGIYTPYRVFESYAWMHMIYGWKKGQPAVARGDFYDRVIPNYFDPDEFPESTGDGGYYLFIGRNNEDKGINIAIQVCEEIGAKLIVAGQRNYPLPDWVEYRGIVGVEERGELYAGALASFTPTLYVEPFAGTHVESLLCGTPVITTDWGVFSETVQNGVNGFRCRTFAEFVAAAKAVPTLDRQAIRSAAQARFSMDQIKWDYQRYFEDLDNLWEEGWYTGRTILVQPEPSPDVSGDPMALLEGML